MIKEENLKFIDEKDIPPRNRKSKWLETFKKISKGKALVITGSKSKCDSVVSLLNLFKRQGRINKSFKAVKRTINNNIIVYIINSTEANS